MKKITIWAIAGMAMFSVASCASVNTGTSKTMDIVGPGVIHKPIIADLNVNQQKASKTITVSATDMLESVRNNAVRELLKEHQADVLIEPVYESTTEGGRTTVTVYGWPATYKNFRPIEEKDLKLLEVKPNILQKAETSQPAVQNNKGGSLLLWIAGGAAVIAAALLAGGI